MIEVSEKLEEVHVDLWGPHNLPLLSGKTYAAILLDAKTCNTWVYYLRSKDEFVDLFQVWLQKVENKSKMTMKSLCANGGGEFILAKLKEFCETRGITIKYAAPYMHKENGLAERGLKTVMTMKDALLVDSALPPEFWAEAMDTANYLRNRLPTKVQGRGKIISEEAWTGEKQGVRYLKVFGSAVSVVIPKEKRHKSDIYKNWKGIFIVYSQDTTKHIRAWASKIQQILLVSSPYVDESEQGAKLLLEHPLERTRQVAASKKKAPTGEPRPRGRPKKIQVTENSTGQRVEPEKKKSVDNKTAEATEMIEKAMSATETSSKIYEPKTYEEAMSDLVHSRQWREAIEEEIQNLEKDSTWEYERLPPDRHAIESKCVFKVKYHPDGSVY